jgi:hypothetical protein
MHPPPERAGWKAGARGEPEGANPHRPGTPEAAAWARGRAAWTAFVAENRRVWEAGVRAYGGSAPRRRRAAWAPASPSYLPRKNPI